MPESRCLSRAAISFAQDQRADLSSSRGGQTRLAFVVMNHARHRLTLTLAVAIATLVALVIWLYPSPRMKPEIMFQYANAFVWFSRLPEVIPNTSGRASISPRIHAPPESPLHVKSMEPVLPVR